MNPNICGAQWTHTPGADRGAVFTCARPHGHDGMHYVQADGMERPAEVRW